MGASADPAGKEQPLRTEIFDRGPGGPRPLEGGEQQPQGVLDLGIGVEHHGVVVGVGQAHRQGEFERGTTGFVQHAAAQARPQHMQLRLRHRPLQS